MTVSPAVNFHPGSPCCDVAIEIHKVSSLDTLKQILIRCKELSDHVYDTFKHSCQTQEYHGNVWLLLITLNKGGKEKDELRDFNSLLKHCIKDLKTSVCPVFCSLEAEFAENKSQNLIVGG